MIWSKLKSYIIIKSGRNKTIISLKGVNDSVSLYLAITKVINPLILIYELILTNRRIIIPTMIGLIIALTVISETNLIIDSYRQEIFEKLIFDQNNPFMGEININVGGPFINKNISAIPSHFTNFEPYQNIFNQTTELYFYKDRILESQWYSSQHVGFWANSSYKNEGSINFMDIDLYCTSSLEFYTKIVPFLEGRLPENFNEVILIRPEGDPSSQWETEQETPFENFTLNNRINISWSDDSQAVNKTVTITGILTYPREVDESPITDINSTLGILDKYLSFSLYYGFSLLTDPIMFNELLQDLIYNLILTNGGVHVYGKVFLDHSQLNAANIAQEMIDLQKFLQGLEEAYTSETGYIYIHSPVYTNMQEYLMQISILTIISFLVSFPVICIALYLVLYSFGLTRRQKQNQIGILKTRGSSSIQIFTCFLSEIIISTLITVLAGFIISILFADWILRSSDFLVFLGTPIPVKATLSTFQTLIIWGLIISLFLNFVRIFKMSRQEITETIIPSETQPPFWKRFYLDFLMFIIGTITWLILLNLLSHPYLTGGDIDSFLVQIIGLLGIPAPFMMFFGSIMIIARLFPYLMKILSDFLWQIEGGINAFAVRNIIRHKQSANRTVLLMTLAFAFSILASSLIFSVDKTQQNSLYYRYGADIVVSTGGTANNAVLSILEENISHVSEVSHEYNAIYHTEGKYFRTLHCKFVDPTTYAQVAYTDPSFGLSDSLNRLMEVISDNESIVLFKGNIKADVTNPSLGETIKFTFPRTYYPGSIPLKIAGTFKYWPTLYPWAWEEYSQNYYFIGSLGLYENLTKSDCVTQYTESNYLVKISSNENIEEIYSAIQKQTSSQVYSPALQFHEYMNSFDRSFVLSILNSDLLVCAIISVAGVTMFAFFTYIERGKEIGVERTLGMTRLQTAQSFLVEALTIFSFGIVIGFLIGTYFVTMFLRIIQLGEIIPPVTTHYPFELLGQLIAIIMVTAGIGTIVPAYFASRTDISRTLKVE